MAPAEIWFPIGTTDAPALNLPVLDLPMRVRTPTRFRLAADLFDPRIPEDWITAVFAVMAMAPRHEFRIRTSEPGRAVEYLGAPMLGAVWAYTACEVVMRIVGGTPADSAASSSVTDIVQAAEPEVPLPNVWLEIPTASPGDAR